MASPFPSGDDRLLRMDVRIKICGITNVDDALAAQEAGAHALGFMFYEPSPRYVSLDKVEAISACISPYMVRVGVFVNPSAEFVNTAIAQCGLNILQFHGDESPEFCLQFGIMSMKAFRIKDAESLATIEDYRTDAFLLDSWVAGKPGGTGEKFNWDLAIEAKKFNRPIFLAGGLTPQNVAQAIRTVQPFGVDVSSGVEMSPGRKDHQKIRDFVNAVKSA